MSANGPGIPLPAPGTARRALGSGGSVHLIGIGGVGMSALAGMLRSRGYRVRGSDTGVYPPASLLLQRLGIPVFEGFDPVHLADRPDLVVVGNVATARNPEVQALLEARLPYVSFPQALRELFLEERVPVVVAGTHGKTTSTAMLARVLESADRDPSFFVGGHSLDFDTNFRLGRGPLFVVEGDEYDSACFDKRPKFLHYGARALLLTAVEFDHADIYRDLEAVGRAFRRLVASLPHDSPLVVCADFPHALEVASGRRGETFGFAPSADWRPADVRTGEDGVRFTVVHGGRRVCEIRLALAGDINVRNALGVFALARRLGLSREEIAAGLARFRGVARRQEIVGTFGGVTIVDDFAHHPTAVAGTLRALRARFPGRRLWALFEPRSNTSRRRVFQKEYASALAPADRVVVARVPTKPNDPVPPAELFSPEELVSDLRMRDVPAVAASEVSEIVELVRREARPGDVVVLLSNGSFGGLRGLLEAALSGSSA